MVVDLNQGIRCYIAPSQPGDIAENLRVWIRIAQSRPDFLGKNAAGTKRDIPVNDRNFWSGFKMPANEIRWKGPEQFEFEQADLFTPRSEICQNLPAGTGHGSGGDHDNFGILAMDSFDQAVGSIKYSIKFLFDQHQAALGFLHGQLGVVAHLHVGCGSHQLIDGTGIGRIHPDAGGGRRQKAVHHFLVRDINGFKGVGKIKGVQNHHDRQIDRFSQSEGLQGGVESFLAVFTVKLDPSGVTLGKAVGLICPDIPSRSQGPVDFGHHDGQPGGRCPVQQLVHVGQPVGGGGRKCTRTATGSTDHGGHGRMFAFHIYKAGIQGAVRAVLR